MIVDDKVLLEQHYEFSGKLNFGKSKHHKVQVLLGILGIESL